MKRTIALLVFVAASLASPAFAWYLKDAKGAEVEHCDKELLRCHVYCDDNREVGLMTWNGSVWADETRSDKDDRVLAQKIVDAQGTACK
jgi:hypothetical protein